ncbi:MAG: hypothetical protein KAS75_09005 [Planctomycetes bacterium]|nr:hypothetical protein [Planctomycetota bacterium]
MNKKIIVTLLFVLTACAYANSFDPASEAQALIDMAQYGQARDILNKAVGNESLTDLQRAQAMKTLAQFYAKFVGDTKSALRFYGRILKTNLPADNPAKAFAQAEILRFKNLTVKYAPQDEILKKLRVFSSRKQNVEDTKEQITQLLSLVDNYPQYYRLSEVHYYIGSGYTAIKEHGKATKFFNQAQQLKPAVNFFLPVMGKARQAKGKWIRSITNKVSWGTIGVLLIVTAGAFYASRPWQWLQAKHITVGIIVLLLWTVIFCLAYVALTRGFQTSDKIALQVGAEIPTFMGAKLTSPGSRIAGHLFRYTLLMVVGVFIFAIATSRLKCKYSASILNAIFGLLLCAALLTVFYMRFCDNKGVLNSQAKGLSYYPKASIYFRQYDLEPYILTNPKAHPDLNIGNITDRYFMAWVEEHCPFTESKEEHKH